MGNYGDHLRQRRLELGWTQKRTATQLGISDDTLRDWELGRMEPKPRRIRAIVEFLGYDPGTDRYDVAGLIEGIRRQTGYSYEDLATRVGVCADTLVNLRNGHHQPSRRTYRRLKTFAATLDR